MLRGCAIPLVTPVFVISLKVTRSFASIGSPSICAKCHEAGVGPNLKGRGLPPEYFAAIARNGFNAMPAFRVTDIDDATLQSLGEYLSQTKLPFTEDPAKLR